MPGSDLNGAARNPGAASHHQSPVLARAGFRHAFFTRLGGASEGPFESLSFSTAVGDREDHVAENLRRAGRLLGVVPEQVVYLSQVHGATAHFFDEVRVRSELITLEGDAIGGSEPGSAYGVRSADCVPILIADDASGSVMAVHAGWRGVVAGVVEAGVARLRQSIGGPGRLLAAVGPHISKRAFEVSEEVAAELVAACPPAAAASAVARNPGEKPYVDLRFIVTEKLRALGLAGEAIDQVGGCTLLDAEQYFSFRRDGKRSGRHLSAIVPRA
jgi:polyphenol oxidase